MKQTLYWLEPEEKWRKRGYANNLFLDIDYDKRTYKMYKGMVYPKGRENEIQVSWQNDIKSYAGYLRNQGYNLCG